MTEDEARQFAQALTTLCRQHGVMIWTGVASVPIMASGAAGDPFHYEAEMPEFGTSAIIRRVLGNAR